VPSAARLVGQAAKGVFSEKRHQLRFVGQEVRMHAHAVHGARQLARPLGFATRGPPGGFVTQIQKGVRPAASGVQLGGPGEGRLRLGLSPRDEQQGRPGEPGARKVAGVAE